MTANLPLVFPKLAGPSSEPVGRTSNVADNHDSGRLRNSTMPRAACIAPSCKGRLPLCDKDSTNPHRGCPSSGVDDCSTGSHGCRGCSTHTDQRAGGLRNSGRAVADFFAIAQISGALGRAFFGAPIGDGSSRSSLVLG